MAKLKRDFDPSEFTKTNRYGLMTKDPELISSIETAFVASGTGLPVLLLGETGVGKEVFAKYIHLQSIHKHGSFKALNCGAIPEKLVESRLFGHKKGAFTDAISDEPGIFEAAGKGTVFLDEVADLPLEAQVKLLRVLEDGTYHRVGGQNDKKSNARILAATNANIEQAVLDGRFREDLYYRLRGFRIEIKPLRERPHDIEFLARHFLYEADMNGYRFSNEALAALRQHDWRGNVRELKSVVKYGVVMCEYRGAGKVIELSDIASNLVSLRHTMPKSSESKSVLIDHQQNGTPTTESPLVSTSLPPEKEISEHIPANDIALPEIANDLNALGGGNGVDESALPLPDPVIAEDPVITEERKDEAEDPLKIIQYREPLLTLGLSGLTLKELEKGLIKAGGECFSTQEKASRILGATVTRIKDISDKGAKGYTAHKEAFDTIVQSSGNLRTLKTRIIHALVEHFGQKSAAADQLGVSLPSVLNYFSKDKKVKASFSDSTGNDASETLSENKETVHHTIGLSGLKLDEIGVGVVAAFLRKRKSNLSKVASALDISWMYAKKLSNAPKPEKLSELKKEFSQIISKKDLTLDGYKAEIVKTVFEHLGNHKTNTAKQFGVSIPTITRLLDIRKENEVEVSVNHIHSEIPASGVKRVITAMDIQEGFAKAADPKTGLTLAEIGKGVVRAYTSSSEKAAKRFSIEIKHAEKILGRSFSKLEQHRELFNILAAAENLSLREIKAQVVRMVFDGTNNDYLKTAQQLGLYDNTKAVRHYLTIPEKAFCAS